MSHRNRKAGARTPYFAVTLALALCACGDTAPPGTDQAPASVKAAGIESGSRHWRDCRQSELRLYPELEFLRAVVPPGWEPAEAAYAVADDSGTAIGSGRGLVTIALHDCLDDGDGEPIFGGQVGVLVEPPGLADEAAGADYYTIAAYSSSVAFEDLLNRHQWWLIHALGLQLNFDEDGAGLATGGVSFSGAEGSTMAWGAAGLELNRVPRSENARWWRRQGDQTLAISLEWRATHAAGLATWCQFSDGSLAEYASGISWCEHGDASIRHFPRWAAGISVKVVFYPAQPDALDS